MQEGSTATSDSPAMRAAAAASTADVVAIPVAAVPEPVKAQRGGGRQDPVLGKLSGDAAFCDTCGHITVKNGACAKCLNCGTSMGCSRFSRSTKR
jgi:ribonucleoside-diphosphate reductase alpha chain